MSGAVGPKRGRELGALAGASADDPSCVCRDCPFTRTQRLPPIQAGRRHPLGPLRPWHLPHKLPGPAPVPAGGGSVRREPGGQDQVGVLGRMSHGRGHSCPLRWCTSHGQPSSHRFTQTRVPPSLPPLPLRRLLLADHLSSLAEAESARVLSRCGVAEVAARMKLHQAWPAWHRGPEGNGWARIAAT